MSLRFLTHSSTENTIEAPWMASRLLRFLSFVSMPSARYPTRDFHALAGAWRSPSASCFIAIVSGSEGSPVGVAMWRIRSRHLQE